MRKIQILTGMIFGIYIGLNMFAFEGSVLMGLSVIVLSFAAALLVQIIFHEAGHLVFGLLSGYDFVSFRVLSLQLTKTDDGLKFHRFNIAGTGGQCLLEPPAIKGGKYPFRMYLAGGVIFNIVSAVIFYGLSLNTGVNTAIVLEVFAIVGMYLGLTNLYPMTTPIQNDGYNMIYMSEEDERYLWVQLKINAMIMNGKSLYEIEDEYFEYQYPVNSNLEATVAYYSVNRAEEKLDFDKIEEHCSNILNPEGKVGDLVSMITKLSLFYKRAVNNEDIGDLYKEAEVFRKAMPNEPMVIRCEYTYELLVNKDPGKAQIKRDLFDKVSRRYPAAATIDAELRLIDKAEEVSNENILVNMQEIIDK